MHLALLSKNVHKPQYVTYVSRHIALPCAMYYKINLSNANYARAHAIKAPSISVSFLLLSPFNRGSVVLDGVAARYFYSFHHAQRSLGALVLNSGRPQYAQPKRSSRGCVIMSCAPTRNLLPTSKRLDKRRCFLPFLHLSLQYILYEHGSSFFSSIYFCLFVSLVAVDKHHRNRTLHLSAILLHFLPLSTLGIQKRAKNSRFPYVNRSHLAALVNAIFV